MVQGEQKDATKDAETLPAAGADATDEVCAIDAFFTCLRGEHAYEAKGNAHLDIGYVVKPFFFWKCSPGLRRHLFVF
jgi:hypothetical protein